MTISKDPSRHFRNNSNVFFSHVTKGTDLLLYIHDEGSQSRNNGLNDFHSIERLRTNAPSMKLKCLSLAFTALFGRLQLDRSIPSSARRPIPMTGNRFLSIMSEIDGLFSKRNRKVIRKR